jgi:hypothetical protein
MQLVTHWLNVLQQWLTYCLYCVGRSIQAPECKPFWTWVMIGFLAFGALVLVVMASKIVSYKFRLAAALKAEEQRARVDHDGIAAGRWDGDKAYSAELGGEEVERRIREVVEQRRAASPSFPDLISPNRREQ